MIVDGARGLDCRLANEILHQTKKKIKTDGNSKEYEHAGSNYSRANELGAFSLADIYCYVLQKQRLAKNKSRKAQPRQNNQKKLSIERHEAGLHQVVTGPLVCLNDRVSIMLEFLGLGRSIPVLNETASLLERDLDENSGLRGARSSMLRIVRKPRNRVE